MLCYSRSCLATKHILSLYCPQSFLSSSSRLQWMSIVRELQFTFFSCCINCSREKTIGFPLFQYRLVKTHLEILWGCNCWCLTKIDHSEGVYIGCYGYRNCNRQPEVINFPKWAQFRTIYGSKNGKSYWPVAKVSKKNALITDLSYSHQNFISKTMSQPFSHNNLGTVLRSLWEPAAGD